MSQIEHFSLDLTDLTHNSPDKFILILYIQLQPVHDLPENLLTTLLVNNHIAFHPVSVSQDMKIDRVKGAEGNRRRPPSHQFRESRSHLGSCRPGKGDDQNTGWINMTLIDQVADTMG